jgi:hypothetical protein
MRAIDGRVINSNWIKDLERCGLQIAHKKFANISGGEGFTDSPKLEWFMKQLETVK